MKKSEIIEYLDKFDGDPEVYFPVLDIKNRIRHLIADVRGLDEVIHPIIAICVEETEPFDQELIDICEEAEREENGK